METVQKTIDSIILFEKSVASRAKRLLEINKKLEYDIKFSRVIYDNYKHYNFKNITVKFTETTFHEPESYLQDITFEQLSYSEEEFDNYINNIIKLKEEKANDLKKKQEEQKIKEKEQELQRKIQKFERLKLELGR